MYFLKGGFKSWKILFKELLLLCEEKRLKYEAMEAEVFRDKRNMQENYEEQIQKILNEHMAEIKMQKMNFVVEHSKSKVAELNGKVESGELMIAHLKGIIEDLKEDQEKLKFSKVRKVINDGEFYIEIVFLSLNVSVNYSSYSKWRIVYVEKFVVWKLNFLMLKSYILLKCAIIKNLKLKFITWK